MVEHGHPFAVGLAGGGSEPLKQKVDDGDFRAEQGSSLPARIGLEPDEIGDRRRDGERGHARPTRGRRHTAGSANDDKSLQHVRHEFGMIPVDTAVVGGDEHRPRRPEHLEQAAETGVGDGEGADVLVAVPALVVTHEIGQGEAH